MSDYNIINFGGDGGNTTDCYTKEETNILLNGKQDTISNLNDIIFGSNLGKTSIQSIDGLAASVLYDSTTKRIVFYDMSGNELQTYIDATDFIKDGMIESVEIVEDNLVISFNTDSGKEDIYISLSDIFNPNNYYTKNQTDTMLQTKQSILTEQTLSTVDSSIDISEHNHQILKINYTPSNSPIKSPKNLFIGGSLPSFADECHIILNVGSRAGVNLSSSKISLENDFTIPQCRTTVLDIKHNICSVTSYAPTIKDFAMEYVKTIDIWNNNKSDFTITPEGTTHTVTVPNARTLPTNTTLNVNDLTINTVGMLELGIRCFLILCGKNGYDANSTIENIASLDHTPNINTDLLPITVGYYWGDAPWNEWNGGNPSGTANPDYFQGAGTTSVAVSYTLLANLAGRLLSYATSHSNVFPNICSYNSSQVSGYSGTFSAQRALMTFARVFKYIVDYNVVNLLDWVENNPNKKTFTSIFL